jgi:hypothetical protein
MCTYWRNLKWQPKELTCRHRSPLLFYRYMLTQEGKEVARECLMRSGLGDPAESLANAEGFPDKVANGTAALDFACLGMGKEMTSTSMGLSRRKKSIDVPFESLERVHVEIASEKLFSFLR